MTFGIWDGNQSPLMWIGASECNETIGYYSTTRWAQISDWSKTSNFKVCISIHRGDLLILNDDDSPYQDFNYLLKDRQ